MTEQMEMISRTQRLLEHAEAMRDSMRQLTFDLAARLEVIHEELDWLRERASVDDAHEDSSSHPYVPVSRKTPVPKGIDQASAVERRSMPRRVENPVLVLISDMQPGSQIQESWVVDRSKNGLGLVVQRPIPVGTVVSVRPAHADSRFRWIRVQVKNCRPDDGQWRAGCRFQEVLSLGEIRQFG